MNINFKKLLSASKNLDLKNNLYIQTYPEFVKYFKGKNINKHNLIIGSHFVYGWMPTILKKLNLEELNRTLKLLNQKEDLELDDLRFLKSKINNSMIGLSKLLHFINPKHYAIWDSRVGNSLGVGTTTIQNPERYLDYLSELNDISKLKEYKSFHKRIENTCGYKVTPFRAIELVMFELGKK